MTAMHSEGFVDAVRKLWNEDFPTSEIGRRLGVSKNVVVGIAHRNPGFARRKGVAHRKPKEAAAAPTRSLDLRGCRWIAGEPNWSERGDAIYCGAATEPGEAYCPPHRARAYIPITPKMAKAEAA